MLDVAARWRAQLVESWPPLMAVGVFALALWAQHDAMVGVFFDDGIYVTLAKALAEGEGYRNIHLPGAPAAVHFPPLYPLALSLLWRLWPAFPDNVALFQIFDSAALAGAAWVIAGHARRVGMAPVAQYLALPLGFAAFPLLTVVGVRFSEPLFLLLAAGAIAVADGRQTGLRQGLGAGVLAALATLTRSVGLAVTLGVIVAFVVRRQRPAAIGALVAAVLLLTPWVVWTFNHGEAMDPRLVANYGTYAADLGQSGAWTLLFQANPFLLFAPIARLVLPAAPGWVWYPLAAALVTAMVWGALGTRNRAMALIITLAAYAGIVSAWPFTPDRFVWIVLPWLFALLAAGLAAAWSRNRLLRLVVLALIVMMVLGYARREAISLGTRGFAETSRGISASFRVLVPAIDQEVTDSAVVASADEALIYLYTGRKAVPSYLFRWRGRAQEAYHADVVADFFCDSRVTHLALTGPGEDAAAVASVLRHAPGPTVIPLFELTKGPALYRFQCSS